MTLEPLQGEERVEVAVLGEGPATLALAARLQGAGVSVGLYSTRWFTDPRPALALPVTPEHHAALVRDLGLEPARAWWALASAGVRGLEALLGDEGVGCQRGGALLVATSEGEARDLQDGLPSLAEAGFLVRMMGPAAATNYLPVEPGPGALYVPGALIFEEGRVQEALLLAVERGGGRIRRISSRLSLEQGSDEIRIVTAEGTVRAELVVVGDGVPLEAVPGASPAWVRPICAQALSTGPLREGFTATTVAASFRRGHDLVRGLERGLIGFSVDPGAGVEDLSEVERVDPAGQARLERFLEERFPEVRRAGVVDRWARRRWLSQDGLPWVGALPGQVRVHLLCGFGLSPWSLGIGAALALDRLIRGEEGGLPPGSSPRRRGA